MLQADQLFDLLTEIPVAIAGIHAICQQQSKQTDAIGSVVVGVAIHLCTKKQGLGDCFEFGYKTRQGRHLKTP